MNKPLDRVRKGSPGGIMAVGKGYPRLEYFGREQGETERV
jgi:hypothetical protein